MTPESLFHQMLGLGTDWEVWDCRFDVQTGLVTLHIRETPELWASYRCPDDGGEAICYDHTEELVWRHLNVFEHHCQIHCRLPRARCKTCRKILRVKPPWEGLSKHFTRGFEAFALLLMREMPVARVAEVVDEHDTRLWRMLFAHVEAAYQAQDMSEVIRLGVDEMCIRKGREYLTIFVDLKGKAVLFVTEGKDKATWERFLAEWEKHGGHRHQLLQVSMDMSKAYRAAVSEWCRHAEVVFDKYHVVAHVHAAVDQVRQYELRYGPVSVREALKKTMWIWRKNQENLTEKEKERLAGIEHKNLWTAKAYQVRLVFQDIYRSATAEQARRRFRVWCRWVRMLSTQAPRNYFAAMVGAAKMVRNHLDGIVAHWKGKVTNAFMEGLNSVFSATKRKARGYRSTEHLTAVLYLVAAKLRIPFH